MYNFANEGMLEFSGDPVSIFCTIRSLRCFRDLSIKNYFL